MKTIPSILAMAGVVAFLVLPTAKATTYYQDSFSRTGELNGSTPSVVDTGGNTWTTTTGTGQYMTNGSLLLIGTASYPYSAAYLPVNGSSGVTLDGSRDFTLSVVVTPGSAGMTGISLSTGMEPNSYNNLFGNDLATVTTGTGFTGSYAYNGGSINYNYGKGSTGPTTISLAYSAAAGTLTYTVGGSVLLTQPGVSMAQIAALRAVALGDDGYGGGAVTPAAAFGNFMLTVGTGNPPAVPAGLTAAATSIQVSLSWTASSGAASYSVYRGTSSGGESATAIATGITSTSYTDSSVTYGTTYYYEVAGVNGVGTSGYSNEAIATPAGVSLPPTGLAASSGDAQVGLSWQASVGAASYNVYRGTSPGGESATAIATGIATTSYTDGSVINGTIYYYVVAAVNSFGVSGYSGEASTMPTNLPLTPAGLLATAGNAQIGLNWTASKRATSYNVYRGTSSGGESATAIATGIASTSYTDTGVATGTIYYYKVAAADAYGSSGYSNEANATPTAGGGTGDIDLTGYTLTFNDEFDTLSLSTTSPKGSAKWYGYPPNGGTGWFSASAWNPSAFSVSNGVLTDLCWYSSTAINNQNWQSGYMASVDTTTAGFSQTYGYFEIRCQMPNAGDGAWAAFWLDSTSGITGGQGNEEVDIFEWYGICNTPGSYQDLVQETSHNWNTDGSQNTTTSPYLQSSSAALPDGLYPWQGYHIYGCQIDPVHMTWYIDGLKTNQCGTPAAYMNTPFYVMVNYALGGGWPLSGAPFSTDGSSSMLVDWVRVYSLPATMSGAPTAPAGLTATAGNGQVVLNWTASPGATSYNIYQGTNAEGEGAAPIATGITTTSSTNTGVTNGTTYYYTVAAVNSSGTSGSSNEASATPSLPTFTQWANGYFAASPANGGETATPQNDGVTNLMKYLCDINPTVPMKASDWAALPVSGTATISGSSYLTLTYRQSQLETGLTINLQTSADLQTWQTVTPAHTLNVGTDPVTNDPLIQLQVLVDPPGASKEFIRVNVVGP